MVSLTPELEINILLSVFQNQCKMNVEEEVKLLVEEIQRLGEASE